MKTILCYDGSFEGFLSCIFYVNEYSLDLTCIQRSDIASANFFDELVTIPSEERKAKRVWKGISQRLSLQGRQNFYKAFLSEIEGIEDTLLQVIRNAFKSSEKTDTNFSDPYVLRMAKVAKMVGREKHRMDAFIRFRLTKDGLYFATVEPDFNVLPLNAKHFKNRYADQKWLIYDLKRKYGIFYDLQTVSEVTLQLENSINLPSKSEMFFTSEEMDYQDLWKNYFKSTNIVSRRNMKLHLQHVPRRYWKYLSEKQLN